MIISLIIAMAVWIVSIVTAIIIGRLKYKTGRILKPTNVFLAGTFVSALILFFPIYFKEFANNAIVVQVINSLLISAHHTLRLFLIDTDFEIIQTSIVGMDNAWAMVYSTFAAVLFVSAPILTFDFILSFFKNVSSYRQYLSNFFKDVYVFSDLNEKSLALAESIVAKNKKNVIVFTDVKNNEECRAELIEKAKELGAICFKKDILSINFNLHSKNSVLSFFAISEDDTANVNQSMSLVEKFKDRKNTMLYTFSISVDGELVMSAMNKGEVKVRRIKDVRSLIYRTLYEMEENVIQQRKSGVPAEEIKPDLFMSAKSVEGGIKRIGAVVVGCGLHGAEMVKALTWFCQMDGYRVSIDVFDKDKNAKTNFAATCPELMDEKYNGVYVDGEAQYFINFQTHKNEKTDDAVAIDVNTTEFIQAIKGLTDTTYVFVALGSDEENIKTAVALRTIFEQMKIHPIIHAVVYNSDKKKALSGICNFKEQPYDIEFVGDLETLYSADVIIDSALEQDALSRHLKYGAEEDFWSFEYNYRSSTASALHMMARIACGIAGADKKEEDLTAEERAVIEPLEHRRWNAYMRSEGYVYSGSKEKSSRNDLGKMHHDLVTFDELSEEDKRKDSRVGSK